MKRKHVLGIVMTILAICFAYYLLVHVSYEPAEEFSGFPIPKYAEETRVTEDSITLQWSLASEENGIPFVYKKVIKQHGWEEVGREGALVSYRNGKHLVDIISLTNELSIIDVK